MIKNSSQRNKNQVDFLRHGIVQHSNGKPEEEDDTVGKKKLGIAEAAKCSKNIQVIGRFLAWILLKKSSAEFEFIFREWADSLIIGKTVCLHRPHHQPHD